WEAEGAVSAGGGCVAAAVMPTQPLEDATDVPAALLQPTQRLDIPEVRNQSTAFSHVVTTSTLATSPAVRAATSTGVVADGVFAKPRPYAPSPSGASALAAVVAAATTAGLETGNRNLTLPSVTMAEIVPVTAAVVADLPATQPLAPVEQDWPPPPPRQVCQQPHFDAAKVSPTQAALQLSTQAPLLPPQRLPVVRSLAAAAANGSSSRVSPVALGPH
ncbi:hypothetical protein Vafri_15528, partial [Volvox africanus]